GEHRRAAAAQRRRSCRPRVRLDNRVVRSGYSNRVHRSDCIVPSAKGASAMTTTESAAATPSEVAHRVRQMVEGEQVDFAAMFAADGVLEYPFSAPGMPERLDGREEIRAFV